MPRSLCFIAPLFAATALTFFTGCQKNEMQRCVDEQNMVVDDDLCHAVGEQRTLGGNPHKPEVYRYYYGGTGSAESGTVAEGGSFEPDPNRTYRIANSSVSPRQGFSNKYAPWIIGAAGIFLLWKVGGRRPRRHSH
jgi:hypothetical protein